MFYTVIENQKHANGAYALLYNHYENETDALCRFFTVCTSAAQSELPYHSAHILNSDGIMVRQEIFRHGEDVV